ncbi:MAG: hypothetical protein Q8L55_08645 [Phycisphaerales bacterium]|nr:hypothetical protein [Phycisphaerales bacterium]
MKTMLVSCAAIAVLAGSALTSAQTLYATGWEAAPASPGWNTGNVAPQNAWTNFNNAGGHQVVNSGATIAGTVVTAAAGSRFHASVPSTSATTVFGRWSWVDLTAAWAGRTAGNDFVIVSMDMFLPTGSTAACLHGVEGYGDSGGGAGTLFLGGFVVNPNNAGLYIEAAGGVLTQMGTVPRNTWFRVDLAYHSATGEMGLALNGTYLGFGQGAAATVSVSDWDLFNRNSVTGTLPGAGSNMATDNYSVVAVPTPGAAALLGLGGLVAGRRRRN